MRNVGEFILDHTLASYVLWLLMFFFMTTPLVMTAPLDEPTRFGWMAWATVGSIVYALTVAVIIDRKGTDRRLQVLGFQWILAQGPLLFSIVAQYDRAPQWLCAVAFAEALVVMTWAVRRARSKDQRKNDPRVETTT